jgi:carbonic anhydrase/acetyltransferase-like protein (isoleucine patch superfamily)
MIYQLGDRQPRLDGDGHFIAPSASVIGNVTLKQGASIWFNAVLRGDNDLIEIGVNSNIQDGAVLHTDPGIELIVGDNVTVGHQVMLHGCTIGNNSLIGIGSTLLNRSSIGNNCIVGAHSLITEGKKFPDAVLILGSPAKVIRELEAAELEFLKYAADVYVQNSQRFLDELSS